MIKWVATVHLDWWNVQPEALYNVTQDYDPFWSFLNRYGGLRWPQQSRGAWVGFRDGLDALDTRRFPEATYGKLDYSTSSSAPYPEISSSTANVNRARAICAASASGGCRIDDTKHITGGPMKQRQNQGMNDVAFGNWRDDFGNFAALVPASSNANANASASASANASANASTVGRWRVWGSSASGMSPNLKVPSFFGRFARSWARPTNASAIMGIDLDDGLWGGLPLRSPKDLTVRVIFLDKGTGKFAVKHDSGGSGNENELLAITKRDSGKWMEACVTFTTSGKTFANEGPDGSDVWVANVDAEDDVFDSLEISETKDIGLLGCNFNMEY